MPFMVGTNVIACRPPEHRPAGTPTAHAKNWKFDDPPPPSALIWEKFEIKKITNFVIPSEKKHGT